MGIKENWLKEDIRCKCCGSIIQRQKGITKQNLKRLITPRFDFNEIMITLIIVMVLIMAFAYMRETQQCRDWIGQFSGDKETCKLTCNSKCELLEIKVNYTYAPSYINFSIEQNELNELNHSDNG